MAFALSVEEREDAADAFFGRPITEESRGVIHELFESEADLIVFRCVHILDHCEYTWLDKSSTHLFEDLYHLSWLDCSLVSRQEEFEGLTNLIDFISG